LTLFSVMPQAPLPNDKCPFSTQFPPAGFEVQVVAGEYELQRTDDHAGNRMMRVRRR
jgi:hypothetical protein